MRLRSLVAFALVVPSAAFAQRNAGRIGGARPGQPVPLGRQPELGMRFHPENMEVRIRPFADVRLGFEHSSDQFSNQVGLGIGPASNLVTAERYSRGFGGVIGAGAEYSLTNTFSLTTGVSAMRSNMMAYAYTGTSVPTTGDAYRMTTYRLAIGLRYNPVYAMHLAR
jgi:hypothetical protein